MAQDISDIQQEIIDAVQDDDTLSAKLTSTSKTAIWRLKTYCIAVGIYLLQLLFDEMVEEVDTALEQRLTHNAYWYSTMAKAFQYGYELEDESDTYEEEDEDAQIVTQAAVVEVNGTLYIKIAKGSDGELSPLSTSDPDELTPFTEYMARVKDAGVAIEVVNDEGDELRLVIDIYYDPLVLNDEGALLTDTGTYPAYDTIKDFVTSLSFNGEFIPAELVDALQETEGVDIPEILSVATKYADNDWESVSGKVVPNAGYLNIDDDNLTINYTANV